MPFRYPMLFAVDFKKNDEKYFSKNQNFNPFEVAEHFKAAVIIRRHKLILRQKPINHKLF